MMNKQVCAQRKRGGGGGEDEDSCTDLEATHTMDTPPAAAAVAAVAALGRFIIHRPDERGDEVWSSARIWSTPVPLCIWGCSWPLMHERDHHLAGRRSISSTP